MVNCRKHGDPNLVLHFIQDNYIKPDILIDVTAFWDKKIESIHAYGSQFFNRDLEADEPQNLYFVS